MTEFTPQILLVEDNANVLHLNRSVLVRKGYGVHCAESIEKGRLILKSRPQIDVAVLDIMLPDGNGLDFAREVKANIGCMVLMLTSKRSHADILEGLTSAADDYMTKPYRIEELTARIQALLARKKETAATTIRKGKLTLDIPSGRAFLEEEDLLLSQREFALLLILVQNENHFVSAEALYESAWKLPLREDNGALKTTVSRLRKKLADSRFEIESERGKGYCFTHRSRER